ncbi:MAG: two-component sensor histidine kinase [Proteobacteria bacterium]|nr:MAG: two-component sensor histidine kinase [Pseudomonadota bacterium]
MSARGSLRARLLAGVLLVVTATWLAVSLLGWRRARQETEALFDAHLAQSAAVLVALLTSEHGDEDDDELELDVEHAPELHRYARNVAFQVWERGRKLRVHSRNAPRERLSDAERGFADATVAGARWRVFSTWALGRRALVQVGERVEAREAVGAQIARHLLVPLAVALPLLAIALSLAIGRALAPLRWLAAAVAARDPDRLEPVAAEAVPREVRPLVDRLNELFARIGASLERERAFTADAAHELRTPIAAVRAQAEVARAAGDDAERRRALDHVIAGCDRAARLTDQLLTLARLEQSAWAERLRACDLVAAARAVLADLAQAAHSRGVALALDAPAQALVDGDGTLLQALIRNLVDNAIRYGGSGGRVRVAIAGEPGGIVLRVEDEGPGIPASERARVLDRFHRGMGTGESGAGLGLAICARVAALHGARLSLEDAPGGRGLAVVVRFRPLRTA